MQHQTNSAACGLFVTMCTHYSTTHGVYFPTAQRNSKLLAKRRGQSMGMALGRPLVKTAQWTWAGASSISLAPSLGKSNLPLPYPKLPFWAHVVGTGHLNTRLPLKRPDAPLPNRDSHLLPKSTLQETALCSFFSYTLPRPYISSWNVIFLVSRFCHQIGRTGLGTNHTRYAFPLQSRRPGDGLNFFGGRQ